MSNPIDEETQQKLQDTLTDILKTFAEIFGKKYVLYLVQSVKEEANPPEQPDLVLEDVPDGGSIPSAPLKAGYFVKRVSNPTIFHTMFGTAHKRKFVVLWNQKDNYRMDYSPNENAADKKIGYLAGYKVAKASEEDGPLMIRLAPKMKCVSREWHFRAENEKEFKKWKKAFKIACSKAEPLKDENPLIAKAFGAALNALKKKFSCPVTYTIGMEGERLTNLVYFVLERDIIRAKLDEIEEGPFKDAQVSIAEKLCVGMTRTAVAGAWSTAISTSKTLTAEVEKKAKELIGKIFEIQNQVKDTIANLLGDLIGPFLQMVSAKILYPFLNLVFYPVDSGFKASVEGLNLSFKKLIKRKEFLEQEPRKSLLKALDDKVDKLAAGPLLKPRKVMGIKGGVRDENDEESGGKEGGEEEEKGEEEEEEEEDPEEDEDENEEEVEGEKEEEGEEEDGGASFTIDINFTASLGGLMAGVTGGITSSIKSGIKDAKEQTKEQIEDMMKEAEDLIKPALTELGLSSIAQLKQMVREEAMSNISNIFHRAIYAFQKDSSSMSTAEDLSKLAATVQDKFVQDCKVMMRWSLLNVLRKLVSCPLEKYVFKHSRKAIKPVQQQIDDVPVPGLSELVDLNELLEDTVNGAVDSCLKPVVDGYCAHSSSTLDAVNRKLKF